MANEELEKSPFLYLIHPQHSVSYSLLSFISLPGTYRFLNLSYMVIHTFIIYHPCQRVHSLLAGILPILFLAASYCLEHAWHMVDVQKLLNVLYVK